MKKEIEINIHYDEKIISSTSEIKGFSGEFRWLSNMVLIEPFEYGGDVYYSTENFYQAMKTLDKEKRTLISNMSPKQSKNYCKSYKKNIIIREDWDAIKDLVMEYSLRQKFSQKKFKKLLLLTKDSYIEETNNWNDMYWGVCAKTNSGKNQLGTIIMNLRKELQENKNLLDKKFTIKKKSQIKLK